MRSLHQHRREYQTGRLRRSDLLDNPLELFVRWFDEAREAGNRDPSAMTLATASKDGAPSARMVLLKSVDERGFVFATHYTSPKGRDLEENPHAALVFYWPETERQVRVTGPVRQLNQEENQAIYAARPREAQVAALLGGQSSPVASRETLEELYKAKTHEVGVTPLTVPETWGGYAVTPESIELWQGGLHRLHDRFLFVRSGEGWTVERLMP